MIKKKLIPYLFLTLIMIFFIITNLVWLSQDTLPPSWDQSHHMELSLKYHRLIIEAKSISDIKSFFSISHYYPPFFHISALPIVFIFGFSEHNLIFVHFFYLIVLTITMFGIGKILFNERVGVLAVLLILFYPIMYAMSREYLIDFALVAMVTTAQYLILKSNGGIKNPWNIFLGISAGFTFLTKPVSVIFFIPTWIFVFMKNFQQKKDFFPLLKVILIGLLISGPWYFVALRDLLSLNSYWQNFAITIDHDPVKFMDSMIWYGNVLKNTLISPNLLWFIFVGLLSLFLCKKWKSLFILSLWAIPAFLVLVFTPNKDPRYIMPVLPVFSLIAIGGIDVIRRRIIRNFIYCLIIVIGYIQFNNLSFGVLPSLIKERSFYYNHVPLKDNWKVQEVMSAIFDSVGNKPVIIGILPDCQYFNPPQFIFYAELRSLPYIIQGAGDSEITLEQIKKYDIFIVKYPKISAEWVVFYREKFYRELGVTAIEKIGFNKLKEFDLPDGSKVTVYQKYAGLG